jgi:hypothetical protein
MAPQTFNQTAHHVRLFHTAEARTVTLTLAWASSAAVLGLIAWSVASSTARTIARIAVLYLGNAHG